MSTRPLASWAGLRRICTVVQLSRGRSRRQICARITIGGWAQGEPAATCAKKRTRSPRGRASISKKGLALHDFPPLKESCLIWWMTVRQGWRPAAGTSRGQSPGLEGEAVPHGLTELHQLAGAGRAVGPHLDLRPLAWHDAARLVLHLRRARAVAIADVAPGLQHRLARVVKPIALLHRDAADPLAAEVLDDADAQRLQLAVELTGDPPFPQ